MVSQRAAAVNAQGTYWQQPADIRGAQHAGTPASPLAEGRSEAFADPVRQVGRSDSQHQFDKWPYGWN